MQFESVMLVWFSPTGTTRKVLRAIAGGLVGEQECSVTEVDWTLPEGRQTPLEVPADTLLVLGMPVYMGRVPEAAAGWMNSMRLAGGPVVCVAVYGNRDYDDALQEMWHSATACGGVPVAAAAFVAEHSFSSTDMPVAHGRPDEDDLQQAAEFGRRVRERVQAIASAQDVVLKVPGEFPSQRSTAVRSVDFIAVDDACVQCGQCAEVCPVGAIDINNSAEIDIEACITCCACIKQCPTEARSVKPGPIMEARKRLHTLFSDPKQPELFV